MYEKNLYKPSNKFSLLGIVLMFLSMLAVGFILSWLYLIIKDAIPLIYLNILLCMGVSFAIGGIGTVFIKVYKIRAPKLALIISLIALILVNYAKWAIYVGRDYDDMIYSDLKDTKISEMAEKLEQSQFKLPTTEEEAKNYLIQIQQMKSYNIKEIMKQSASLLGGSDEADKMMSSITIITNVLGDTLGDIMENLLGSSVGEILTNSEKLRNSGSMSMYEYLYEYRGMQVRSSFWLMTHPGELFSDIKNINSVGRWTIKSHRYGWGDNQQDNVSGFLLWMVWAGELALLIIPALIMIQRKAKYPFIESEDEWAVEDKPMPQFMWGDMLGVSSGMVKDNVLRDPEYIFKMPKITVTQSIPDRYYVLTYCRSKYYDEIYITMNYVTVVNPRKNQKKTVPVVTNLRVDADFMATLYGVFDYTVPPLCHGTNKSEDVKKDNEARSEDQKYGRPQAPTPPKATGAEAIFDEPLYSRQSPKQTTTFAEEQLKQEQASKPTSGDMDGIDTSSLNLDEIDLTKM